MNLEGTIREAGALAVERGRRWLDRERSGGRLPIDPLFVTVSGAHIYGFPSPDSDLDLRGAHLLPATEVLGLLPIRETFESGTDTVDEVEIDAVTHDLGKYLRLLTRKNGYILEQIFSPLVVFDRGELAELRAIASAAITRHVVHHYRGFFRSQEELILGESGPTVKQVLYLFRVAMSGLYLLRTRRVQTDLLALNDDMFELPFIRDLVARKMSGDEKAPIPAREVEDLLGEARRLAEQLEPAAEASGFPDDVPNLAEIDAFLVRVRLKQPKEGQSGGVGIVMVMDDDDGDPD